MEGCAFDLLFVRAQTCGAAFSRAAVVWCAFHKAGKCVSFRLLPCVRKGRAAFVRLSLIHISVPSPPGLDAEDARRAMRAWYPTLKRWKQAQG